MTLFCQAWLATWFAIEILLSSAVFLAGWPITLRISLPRTLLSATLNAFFFIFGDLLPDGSVEWRRGRLAAHIGIELAGHSLLFWAGFYNELLGVLQ
jgi:hypothetical protein